MPALSLQSQSVLCRGGFRYFATATMPLPIKSFSGGKAFYRTASGSYTVGEDSWLVLNVQEPYKIEERRLRHAQRLLAAGTANATQAALEVGYESDSSFHASYRRYFGYPPSKTL